MTLKCSTCKKTFKRLNLLRAHRRTHGLGAKLKCDYCNKTFNWPDGLKRHKNKYHGDEIFLACEYV